jgi:hypothetical protein
MMESLIARADRIARAAQRKRLEQIAGSLRDRGLAVEAGQESVTVRGRRMAQRWLADPLLRFAGRYAG